MSFARSLMKKLSMIIVLVLSMLTMLTMVNAETPTTAETQPKAEKFPVLSGTSKGSCCANQSAAIKKLCPQMQKAQKDETQKEE